MRFPRPVTVSQECHGCHRWTAFVFDKKGFGKPCFLAENAVNDLQSNFLSKTFYEFYVYMCIYIYIRISKYNITFCMAMCEAERLLVGINDEVYVEPIGQGLVIPSRRLAVISTGRSVKKKNGISQGIP